MAFAINSDTTVVQPNDVKHEPRPIAYYTLSGLPVYQGFEAQVWIYQTLTEAEMAYLFTLYNANAPRVSITFLDEKTGTWITRYAVMHQPTVGSRQTHVLHDVQVRFSRISTVAGA